jgi:AraC family transcriptional regulator, positive regulator of tynA and feaB
MMMATDPPVQSWRIAQGPEEERQHRLQQAVRRHLPHSFVLSKEESARFRGHVRRYAIGDVLLLDTAATTFEAARGAGQVGSTEGRYVSLMHMRRGRKLIRVGERDYDLGPGDILAFESSSTQHIRVPQQLAKTQLTVRADHLRDLGVTWDHPDGLLLGAATGSARLLFGCLDLARKTLTSSYLTDQAVLSLRNATVELAMATLRDMDTAPSSPSVREAVLHAAREHVRSRLGDPSLGPASAAAALHVSVRTLNRAFNESGEPFTGYVRRMRLERARQDLLALPSSTGVADIAHRWCFADASHFARRFREEFGHAPRDVIGGAAGDTDARSG